MKEEIKKILRVKQPIKAREIAKLLDADTGAVNRALYASGDDFVKDPAHRWSLRRPSEQIIQFPATSWLTTEQFEDALDDGESPLDSTCASIVFQFVPETKVLLAAAARLLALCNQLVAAGKSVTIDFRDTKVSGYLNRIGFYDLLDDDVKVLPRRPMVSLAKARQGENSGVVEVAKIDLDNRDDNIPRRLESSVAEHIEGGKTPMLTILGELFSNIHEHSSSPIPGFVALQLYGGSRPHISTVFSDSGSGIAGTLLPTLPHEKLGELEASGKDIAVALIEKIFVDGQLSRMSEDGHGLGLKSTGDAVGKFDDGSIIVRQETFEVILTFEKGQKRFTHRLGLRRLHGTQICVKFNLTRRSKSR
ncbi:hypothetical protein LA345_20720 [Burkholderia vietnamiensis]|uniref:ATP-binding region, ATPase-like protein n=1 Tax=Burkholderia vietnamiensis (strain G4 / LMG 22486) TaxID=269482 RepID=A4JAI3_BURVG|nr:hypothetical protein [Burkholderia vietnamiensis]ABO53286.1 ATP-binding region, ATPase-like protein [Burkholderia vietnamiensis G4]MCB4346322.1 hypothetical protein [Burkholderia vietnamiensis]